MNKVKIATVWLDGCSGCHMSFLDMDERLLQVADRIELVYSPLVDAKEFPDEVDVTIVEGAVSNQDDLNKIRKVREHTRILVALGDCAVTSNVPSMRNVYPVKSLLERAYRENVSAQPQMPDDSVPPLLPKARPIHEVVKVDLHIPGCPPPADIIFGVVADLLAGQMPQLGQQARFG